MSLTKTNANGWKKDESTGVVINTDMSEYQRILDDRKFRKEKSELHNKIDRLEQTVQLLLSKIR